MSDRSNAQILIGGALCAARLKTLSDAIQAEDLGPAWGDSFAGKDDIIAAIREAAENKTPLLLQRIEVPGGAFEALERLCREINLAYRRSDDGHYAYDAEVAYWRPGMTAAVTWVGSLDHHPYVTVGQIREAYDAGDLPALLDLMTSADQFEAPLVLLPMSAAPQCR